MKLKELQSKQKQFDAQVYAVLDGHQDPSIAAQIKWARKRANYIYDMFWDNQAPNNKGKKFKRLFLMTLDSEICYYFARYILRGRFEEAEPIIATQARYAIDYAIKCLPGRFYLAEKWIAKYGTAGDYRRYKDCFSGHDQVDKIPFPDGEKVDLKKGYW